MAGTSVLIKNFDVRSSAGVIAECAVYKAPLCYPGICEALPSVDPTVDTSSRGIQQHLETRVQHRTCGLSQVLLLMRQAYVRCFATGFACFS